MSRDDIILTCMAVDVHKWRVVLLRPKSKKPQGDKWIITNNPAVVKKHWEWGGNLGLVCGPESGVMVLDFDLVPALNDMWSSLGPLGSPLVLTGSGKPHFYCRWEDGLPAKLQWEGVRVGEIQRGPALQHVVMPPSVHPDTGKNYEWKEDPCHPLMVLPDKWREYLKGDTVPSFIPVGDRTGQPEDEPWGGPPPEELLRRAEAQPGARRRRNGIKFQCPGCKAEGHDRSKDNALVALDGRWGCALDPGHSRAIGEALGVRSVAQEVLGDHAEELRDVSLDDLDG